MAIQKISDVEGEPVVGKFYLVPCVYRYGEAWPIIGPLHNDKDYIGVEVEHWHYDTRFLSDKQIRALFRTVKPKPLFRVEYALAFIAGAVNSSKPTERRFVCKRQMPEFPYNGLGRIARWFPKLEDAYKSVKLSSCLKCPHRGMPLGNLPQDEQGNVVCNGHGLRFNLRTGEMVSRL